MELISNKADALKNKIRPGSIFVSKRTDNLKYIDQDGGECWVVPMSRYYAKDTILRGQPVAICQQSDFITTDDRLTDKYPYVKVYDPNIDEFCIGVATNYAEPGQIVQIQNKGKFNYLTTDSKKAKAEGESPREVYIDMTKQTWIYSAMRGQTVYVSTNATNFHNDHDSKAEEVDNKEGITYDFIDSVYSTKNTIQLGHLTDAPNVSVDENGNVINPTDDLESDHTDQVVTLELDVTGDTRGPLDNTQFILTLGEDIEFEYSTDIAKNDATELTSPYYDEGIYNEVKAVALATHGPTKAAFGITQKTLQTKVGTPLSFIGVRKLGGKAIILPVNDANMTFKDLEVKLTDVNDRGYITLLKSYENSNQAPKMYTEGEGENEKVVAIAKDGEVTYDSLIEAIGKALIKLDPDTFEGYTLTKATDTEADITENIITAAVEGGYFDIYESADLVKYFNIKSRCHGSRAPAGTAILADIRDAERTNVIGLVLSNHPGKHFAGETIKVMRTGRFLSHGKFEVGKEYFLGLNGRLTALNQYWYDTCVKIGTVETDHNLIVDIQEMQHDYAGSVELGSMRPCGQGELLKDSEGNIVQKPERGFVLCDGVTRWNVNSDKQYLWEYLLGQYSKEDLQYDEATNTFVVPKVVMDDGKTVAQIKYTTSGIYHNLPRAPFLRKADFFDEQGSVGDFDITRLVHYGTLEQSRIAPTLENVEVRLFYRDGSTKLVKGTKTGQEFADAYVWHEIPAGFHVYNNDTLYGFEWVVLQNDYEGTDGLYVLHMNISNGLGVCKLGKHGQPISLKGIEYKLQVTAKNLWTREYSLVDDAELAQDMDLNTDSLAPSVNAVRDYYKNKVGTKELEVFGETEKDPQLHSDKDGTQIKGPLTLGKVSDVEKDLQDKDDRFAKHIAETGLTTREVDIFDENGEKSGTKTELVGVHGLINNGASGNLNAARLAGLKLGRGNESVDENLKSEDNYIPYVRHEQSGLLYGKSTVETIGLVEEHVNNENELVSVDIRKVVNEGTVNNPKPTYKSTEDVKTTVTNYEKDIKFGNVQFQTNISSSSEGKVTVDVSTASKDKIDLTGLNSIQVGKATLTEAAVTKISDEGSSIAYKDVHTEKIDKNIKAVLGTVTPNDEFDMDGNPTNDDDMEYATELGYSTQSKEDADGNVVLEAADKLGSALQALYELPLATFQYKRGAEEYKEQLGILVERVNQVRENILAKTDKFAHKRNTILQSDNKDISTYNEGASYDGHQFVDGKIVYDKTAGEAKGSSEVNRIEHNSYVYTEAEAQSIANALNLVTNKKELAQEIRSTVGLLIQAAQETQERLLNVETAVYGFDVDTIPGDDAARSNFVNSLIDTKLQEAINNTPLLLGLNRLMRAVCLELFDTTDLEKIDSEVKSVLGDSDNLGTTVTVATRIDKVDELISDLIIRYNDLIRFYEDALKHAELRRTYEHLSQGGKNVISKEYNPEAEGFNIKDFESEAKDLLESGEVIHDRENTQVDSTGTWKTLPSKEDVVHTDENFVGYSKRNEAHEEKHRPTPAKDSTAPGNEDEVGIVRMPVFTTETVMTTSADGGKQVPVELKKIAYDYDTGMPLFRSQGVAWLDSKVERINLKLSEVTKTLYGIDEIGHELPNRTETFRRNITNLVDDLYPNRSFAVENVLENGMYNPFNTSTDVANGGRSAVEGTPKNIKTDEEALCTVKDGVVTESKKHVSILKHFIDDLYSFKIEQNYVPVNQDVYTGDTQNMWTQTAEELDTVGAERAWYLNADALSSEVVETLMSGQKSFSGAYSQIDLLRDLIGEKDLYINKLNTQGIWENWNTVAGDADATRIANRIYSADSIEQIKKDWTAELGFKVGRYTNEGKVVAEAGTVSKELLESGYTDTVLSRKEKTIANRLTTIEASLDSFAHFVNAIGSSDSEADAKASLDASNLMQFDKVANKARFEETAVEKQLRGVVHGIKSGDNYIFPVFDFDLITESLPGAYDHNLEVLTLLKNEYRVTGKGNLSGKDSVERSYVINAERTFSTVSADYNAVKKDAFGNADAEATVDVKVLYTTVPAGKDKVDSKTLDKKTIYLQRQDVAESNTEVVNQLMKVDGGVAGFVNNTNQTSANMFELLGKAMIGMAQASFNLAHPIHSYFETDDVTGDGENIQPNFHFEDAGFSEDVVGKIDTGRWVLIQNAVLRSGNTSSKANGHIGKMGGSDTFTLKEENLPPHHHYMKYDDYSITSEQILSALQFPKNTGEGSALGDIKTSGDIAWVNLPILSSDTPLNVEAKYAFVYNDGVVIAPTPGLAPIYPNISVGETLGTAAIPSTTNKKVLVAKDESLGQDKNTDTFTFNGKVNLKHAHTFGTVTFVKEKSENGEELGTPKTITVKPSEGHSYGIINDGIQLEGAKPLVRGKEVNNIPHHRLTYIFWRVGKNETVGDPVYYDRSTSVEGGTN